VHTIDYKELICRRLTGSKTLTLRFGEPNEDRWENNCP